MKAVTRNDASRYPPSKEHFTRQNQFFGTGGDFVQNMNTRMGGRPSAQRTPGWSITHNQIPGLGGSANSYYTAPSPDHTTPTMIYGSHGTASIFPCGHEPSVHLDSFMTRGMIGSYAYPGPFILK